MYIAVWVDVGTVSWKSKFIIFPSQQIQVMRLKIYLVTSGFVSEGKTLYPFY